MFAMAVSCALRGVAGVPVTVEADLVAGLPSFTIVGLTDRAIQEARERVRAAVRNGGFEFPMRRVTVNLAPAEVPKEGTCFDLAIAIAVLGSAGRDLATAGTAFLGELTLDASLRPVAGVLPMARSLCAAGVRRLVVPPPNATEAAMVDGLEVVAAPSLPACVAHLDGSRPLPAPPRDDSAVAPPAAPDVDLTEVRGQPVARRALEIAAAGGHNLLMLGPPGAGKTMLARALPALLPDLDADAQLEVAAVHSLRGSHRERPLSSVRPPFRAPHHSVSRAGLIGGGGGLAQPGEISLAHRGVLFMDELCEFPRALLEALRQPLEEGSVTIARARGSVTFPAAFSLVAAANPCGCGYLGDDRRPCRCTAHQLELYATRLSGPVRDRIDLVVHVPRPSYATLFGSEATEEGSERVRRRVAAARARQAARSGAGSGTSPRAQTTLNAGLRGQGLIAAAGLTTRASRLLGRAGEGLALSARAFTRVIRVARTIADLSGDDRVGDVAVGEALSYRGESW